MSRKIVVVYNKKSGSALSARKLRQLFETAGFDVLRMIAISDTLTQDLSTYIKKGSWIAAVGGDGTVSAVASQLVGSKAVLVPIPGGTLNNFTKDLGVDQDIERAVSRAATSEVKTVDIASVNGTYFLNNSSIGVYPRSLVVRESMQEHVGKWPAAIYGIIRTLVRFRTYNVTVDDRSVVTPFVFVGNNDYRLDRAGLGNRTSLDSGQLCVYVVNSPRRWALFRLFVRSLFGTLRADKELLLYRTSSLTIESARRRMHVSHDGEISIMNLPLHYEVHAGKLHVAS